MVALLNSTILTVDGDFRLRTISTDEAKAIVAEANSVESFIGHQAAADAMGVVLDREVECRRVMFTQTPGVKAICLKMRGRLEEGKILTFREMEEIGFELKLLEMI